MSAPVDVSVVTSGHDVADARLHRLVGAFARRGLSVEVLGLGDPAGAPPAAQVRTVPRPGMVGRALLAPRYAAAARGRVLVTLDPDSLVAARAVGALRRRPVVADVHEDYARLVEDREWSVGLLGAGARVVVRLAEHAARTSAATLVADDHVPPGRARRRLVVRNEADLGLVGTPREPAATPLACYVGDVRPSRGLPAMLEAVAGAPGWRFEVVGPLRDADRATALERCARPDLEGRVVWHGRRPPREAWEAVGHAWVGFALLEDTPAFRDTLPSKVYEYLATGIVPVVSDLPRQRRLLEEVGAGSVVADPQEAAAALRRYAEEPERLAAERERALAWSAARGDGGSTYDRAAALVEEVLGRG
ncbi:MAG: glycosyltransferase [Micrococcales bacterium]|nr:glycosyltransferase [Micrococcales bacterium]